MNEDDKHKHIFVGNYEKLTFIENVIGNVFIRGEISVEKLYSVINTYLIASIIILWVSYACLNIIGALALPYCYVPLFGFPAVFILILAIGRHKWKTALLSAVTMISSIGPFWILAILLELFRESTKILGINHNISRWFDQFITPTPNTFP